MKEHNTVYRQNGRFAGWPANHGGWNWGDEILISFQDCEHDTRWEDRHSVVPDCVRYMIFARSLDGGKTWRIERPEMKHLYDQSDNKIQSMDDVSDCPGGVDFSHPGFCAYFTLSGTSAEHPSWWGYSLDRGRHWSGPYNIPNMGFSGINARTDYHIRSADELTVFLTATRSDNLNEGQVICAKLSEGGAKWELTGVLGDRYPEEWEIMPASARRENGDWVVLVRGERSRSHPNREWWYMSQYESYDDGKTWTDKGPILPIPYSSSSNPPALVAMKNGAWCVAYGWRREPYGLRCMFSRDEGRTWGPEIVLRDDAAYWDLGYPRMVENASGQLVVAYYYNETGAGERYIDATVFDERA